MYSIYPVPDVPPLTMFQAVHTLDDVTPAMKRVIEKNSCTACYFDDEEAPIFFRDQQDCCLWWFDKASGCVYAAGKFPGWTIGGVLSNSGSCENSSSESDGSGEESSGNESGEETAEEWSAANSTLVAHNLSTFLSRMLLEDAISREEPKDVDPTTAQELERYTLAYREFYASLPADGIKQYYSLLESLF
jgi:hypothetical protein